MLYKKWSVFFWDTQYIQNKVCIKILAFLLFAFFEKKLTPMLGTVLLIFVIVSVAYFLGAFLLIASAAVPISQ